jgi:ribose/xylose/arabinose/galactoside ABC-type transport system permease subunit
MVLGCFNNGLTCVGLGAYWKIVASGILLIMALMVDFLNNQMRMRNLNRAKI